MKKFFPSLIIVLFPLFGFCQNTKSVEQLFDGKVMLALPKKLNATEKNKGEKVDYLFANKKQNAVLMITATDQTVSDNNIPAFADSMITEIKKLQYCWMMVSH